MRIGVFLERQHDGTGGFQQAFSMVESLARPGALAHEVVVFSPHAATRERLREAGIASIPYASRGVRLLDRWSATTVGGAVLRRLRRIGLGRLGRHLDALLDDHGIDLAVFTECAEAAIRTGDHPFVVTVWDTFNRDLPEFPEVYRDRQFDRWERAPRATLTRALAVIVDSPFGARRIAQLYRVDPHRIVVIPFVPAASVRRHAAAPDRGLLARVRARYRLPERYAFWPSFPASVKNHLYLFEALASLERRHGVRLPAVLCGGGGERDWALVRAQAAAAGVADRVHFLGLVPDADLPALYEGATALAIPTYSGPTNLPPLEAAALGCPVIHSDLPEFREQMGEGAVYCDLRDPDSLADRLHALLADPALTQRLRESGFALARRIAAVDYAARLAPVLDEYAALRRRWTWPQG